MAGLAAKITTVMAALPNGIVGVNVCCPKCSVGTLSTDLNTEVFVYFLGLIDDTNATTFSDFLSELSFDINTPPSGTFTAEEISAIGDALPDNSEGNLIEFGSTLENLNSEVLTFLSMTESLMVTNESEINKQNSVRALLKEGIVLICIEDQSYIFNVEQATTYLSNIPIEYSGDNLCDLRSVDVAVELKT